MKYRIIQRDDECFVPQTMGLLGFKSFKFYCGVASFEESFKTLEDARQFICDHRKEKIAKAQKKIMYPRIVEEL